MPLNEEHLRGLLYGCVVGDAVGLPAEGLSRKRVAAFYEKKGWRHRLFCGRGMISDDSEQTLFVAQALIKSGGNSVAFQKSLAWKLRWWFVCLPAGVGLATARAIIRLWCGWPAHRAGVNSGGNGAAMRVALLGAMFAEDTERRHLFVKASTAITHHNPLAEAGAIAIADMAAWIVRGDPELTLWQDLFACSDEYVWQHAITQLQADVEEGKSVDECAQNMGRAHGISGYVMHTVPIVICAFLKHRGDFKASVEAVWNCGGDVDTTGAIIGSLAGLDNGSAVIPQDWLDGLIEWPRSLAVFDRAAIRLMEWTQDPQTIKPVGYAWPLIPFRNILFLIIVLLHGFRRLLPPYGK